MEEPSTLKKLAAKNYLLLLNSDLQEGAKFI